MSDFQWDESTARLCGPQQYMEERGNTLLHQILEGQDPGFIPVWRQSPNLITAMLTRLQTDYAGWRGMEDLIDTIQNTVK